MCVCMCVTNAVRMTCSVMTTIVIVIDSLFSATVNEIRDLRNKERWSSFDNSRKRKKTFSSLGRKAFSRLSAFFFQDAAKKQQLYKHEFREN